MLTSDDRSALGAISLIASRVLIGHVFTAGSNPRSCHISPTRVIPPFHTAPWSSQGNRWACRLAQATTNLRCLASYKDKTRGRFTPPTKTSPLFRSLRRTRPTSLIDRRVATNRRRYNPNRRRPTSFPAKRTRRAVWTRSRIVFGLEALGLKRIRFCGRRCQTRPMNHLLSSSRSSTFKIRAPTHFSPRSNPNSPRSKEQRDLRTTIQRLRQSHQRPTLGKQISLTQTALIPQPQPRSCKNQTTEQRQQRFYNHQ